MSDTTRIMDLPENVTMEMNTGNGAGRGDGFNTSYAPMDVHPNPYGHPPPSVPSLPTPTTQPRQGSIPPIQQTLPSRDIPMDQSHLVQDPQVQANYLPPVPDEVKQTSQYMRQYDELNNKKIEVHRKEEREKSRTDKLIEEAQMPVLVGMMFFIMHMPIIESYMMKYLSFLAIHSTDGHFNMNGLIMRSVFFGILYYAIIYGINMLNV